MCVGKSTGKGLDKERSGIGQTRKNKVSRAIFSPSSPILRSRTLDLTSSVLCHMAEADKRECFCLPSHPVNKCWWERKREWSYDSLMRLLHHGLLKSGSASHSPRLRAQHLSARHGGQHSKWRLEPGDRTSIVTSGRLEPASCTVPVRWDYRSSDWHKAESLTSEKELVYTSSHIS